MQRRQPIEICRECENLQWHKEDERFDVPARYPGDQTVFGDIVEEPWCEKDNDETPDISIYCPLAKEIIIKMRLPIACVMCDSLIIERIDGKIEAYCDVHNCRFYHHHEEYENSLGELTDEEISGKGISV